MNRQGRLKFLALATFPSILAIGPTTQADTLQQLQQQEAQAQAQLAQEQAAYRSTEQNIQHTVLAIQALSNQLASANNQIGTLSQRIAVVNANIEKTQGLIDQTQAQLTATQTQLTATETAYQTTSQELVATQKSLAYHSHLLSGQLQLIEERGSVGYLDVLLGAHSFSDFLSRMALLGQVADAAAKEVQAIKQDEAAEAAQKARLQADTVYLQEARNSIAQHEAALQSAQTLLAEEKSRALTLENQALQTRQVAAAGLSQRQVLMNQLQMQRQSLAANMAALESRIAYIVRQIQSLLGQYNQGDLSRHALFEALLPLVEPIAQQDGLSPALVIAVITQESGGNANAQSYAGAVGLMQLMPSTAADIAQELGMSPQAVLADLTNPQENVMLGCFYLHVLLGQFNGNTELALAAYNAGPGAVGYLVNRHGASWPAISPYLTSQTQNYVPDVMALYTMYSNWLNG